ncbi:hypothetical protein [Patulibacter americanus]|uniref:hypothetical protein n=1 Tax=Patulibacter americanus TaxID=588672 RepID=UPI00048ECAB1|nr:hypothetical protein [Patulibacter americanus]
MNISLKRPVGLLLTAGLVMAAPTAAHAFVAIPGPGNEISLTTGVGNDSVSVSRVADGRLAVDTFGQALEGPAPSGCTNDEDLQQLLCPSDTQLVVMLGDGDDQLDVSSDISVVAFGQAGNDIMQSAPVTGSRLDGGAGNDLLTGNGGIDVLSGGTGDDQLDGGGGGDVLDGGTVPTSCSLASVATCLALGPGMTR